MNIPEIVGLTAGVSGIAGGLAGHFWVRLRGKKLPETVYVVENRTRKIPLAYGYTLNGRLTGENVPEGFDPVDMAARKSRREGRTYGVTRITPR